MAGPENTPPAGDPQPDGTEEAKRELSPEELAELEQEKEFVRKLVRIWRRARLYEMDHQTIQDDLDDFMELSLIHI